jgi:hypothetical protein
MATSIKKHKAAQVCSKLSHKQKQSGHPNRPTAVEATRTMTRDEDDEDDDETMTRKANLVML